MYYTSTYFFLVGTNFKKPRTDRKKEIKDQNGKFSRHKGRHKVGTKPTTIVYVKYITNYNIY